MIRARNYANILNVIELSIEYCEFFFLHAEYVYNVVQKLSLFIIAITLSTFNRFS